MSVDWVQEEGLRQARTGWGSFLSSRLREYRLLIKEPQTALLVFTGVVGYLSGSAALAWPELAALAGSLLLAVSGSTILNMVHDADIDAAMERTAGRPLPDGRIGKGEALAFGLACSLGGLLWAFALSPLFAAVVLAGLFFDVVVYTYWLKRKTAWSILWGGIAGGMPALAGRVLATGEVDLPGILLALAVLFWIPSHIMTLSGRYAADYRRAGVPVFPNVYGERVTQWVIVGSTLVAVLTIGLAAGTLGLPPLQLMGVALLGLALLGLAVGAGLRGSARLDFMLFKFASLYMVGVMGLLVL